MGRASQYVMIERRNVMIERRDVMIERKNVMIERKNVMIERKNVMIERKNEYTLTSCAFIYIIIPGQRHINRMTYDARD